MLQGTLDTFGLGDVLTLLASTGKTGRLRLDGDRGTGSLWFDSGEVVSATAGNVPGDSELTDVLFELLRFGHGEFTFGIGEAVADPGPPQAVQPLLAGATEMLVEWRELTAVVPSLVHQVALVADLVDDQVVLDRDQWRTVLAIGSSCTVGALSEALGVAEVPVLRRVCELLDRGLVEVLEPAGRMIAVPGFAGGSGAGPVVDAITTFAATAVVPEAPHDAYAWTPSDADRRSAEVLEEGDRAPEQHHGDMSLLGQLGGLSPRAAQAVSEVTGGDDDSVLMAFLRDEV